ncbi:MAG: hypothetical protein QXT00_07145 [Ignisphaera sp.]
MLKNKVEDLKSRLKSVGVNIEKIAEDVSQIKKIVEESEKCNWA